MGKINDYVNKAKGWLESKTVWGITIMVLDLIALQTGLTFTASEFVADIFSAGTEAATTIEGIITAVVGAWGALRGYYGRWAAKFKLSGLFGKPDEDENIVIPPKPTD